MRRYRIWTIGCQMNKAESRQIEGLLCARGYRPAATFEEADLIILNTCVVRQSAEDRVIGTLGLLQGVKREKPGLRIAVTGCFAVRDRPGLGRSHPHVDLFFGPGEYDDFSLWLEAHAEEELFREQDAGVCVPEHRTGSDLRSAVSAYVPIMQGCNNFCTYCIVPYTRGREVSRPPEDIEAQVRGLVQQGVKEVTLLGQNVDSYGHGLEGTPDLAFLLERLHPIEGLLRIRFVTNHPKDMSPRLIQAMSRMDKVCEHLDLALQSGDDAILKAMGRGYTVAEFKNLVSSIRASVPSVALSTDIIVGFPGESGRQFENTFSTLQELRFDVVHVAAYSPRPGTAAASRFYDDVPDEVKSERLHRIELLQEDVAGEINGRSAGLDVEVLVEGSRRGKWYGRTRTDKLVFLECDGDVTGQLVHVSVSKTSPWALQGQLHYNTGLD